MTRDSDEASISMQYPVSLTESHQSRLTLKNFLVNSPRLEGFFYIGSNHHNNYTCRDYIFCLNLPFENV